MVRSRSPGGGGCTGDGVIKTSPSSFLMHAVLGAASEGTFTSTDAVAAAKIQPRIFMKRRTARAAFQCKSG
jgi:hypothetical protein